MLHNGHQALVVDPGSARPVIDALKRFRVTLDTILVTHHHADHTGGVNELREKTGCKVFGPTLEPMPEPITRLSGGDQVRVLGLVFQTIAVPGHTLGHIAYYCQQVSGNPLLFCGDTLFSGGCGRLFEGSPDQMLRSLDSLSALPDATLVCCAHEYTLSNLNFAASVDPDNKEIVDYMERCKVLRADMRPSLPSTIRTERLINPFLRTREPAIVAAVKTFDKTAKDEVTVFAALRQWKNSF